MRGLRKREEESQELDLAPMLAMIVSLIPVLLLSFSFYQLSVIEADLPQVTKEAKKKDKKKDRISVKFFASKNGDAKFQVLKNGRRVKTLRLARKKGDEKFDYKKIHETAIKVKKMFPQTADLNLYPDESLGYEVITQLMDELRKVKSGEEKIKMKDEKTGKPFETELLYPQIVFANIFNG